MTTALALIERISATRSRVQQDAARRGPLEQLQRWQVERLRRTYADFGRDPRYSAALEFFVGDLYGPHEFSQRDADLRMVLRSWERLVPPRALAAVVAALELEALTLDLDLVMADALESAVVTEDAYTRAYRRTGRRADRERQIRLILDAGRALDQLIHLPVIGAALRMARTPARLAGVMYLHRFLERGYKAFARMKDARPLLAAIEQRELAIMERLFAGEPDPFRIGDGAGHRTH